ncbi:hypothetical protein GCM10020295_09250 [Streptomyces cinereospinus]
MLTVAQALVLPARPVEPGEGGFLADWRETLGNRAFLAFSLAMVGLFTLENQLYLLLPAGARQATGWDGAAGLVFLAGTLVNLTLQLRLTRALKRRGSRARWICAGLLLTGLAFLPPATVAGSTSSGLLDAVPVLLGALLLYTGLMIASPFVMELVPAFGRPELTGTYYGIFYVVSGVAAALGNTVVGWAMDTGQGGARWLPWACCVLFGLASALGVALLHRRDALPTPPRAAVPARA